jgi:hypothetical protein
MIANGTYRNEAQSTEADPCLVAFLDWMDERRIKAERHPTGPDMFENRRVEAMFEGFVCAWGLHEHLRNAAKSEYF